MSRTPPETPPDFGPRGYLPERAAHRARKIVLRGQMGVGWPLAAVGAALLVAAVGVVFLLTRTGPPRPPLVAAGPIDAVVAGSVAPVTVEPTGHDVLVVRAGGTLRVLAAPAAAPLDGIAYCARSRRLESPAGAVWTLEGTLVGGEGPTLRPVASSVYEGTLYVDAEAVDATALAPAAREAPADGGESPICTIGQP